MLNLFLPATNRFASQYLQQSEEIRSFFHYRFNDFNEDSERLSELRDRQFPRVEVAKHIEQFMERFPVSNAVQHSLEKLKQENSVVVIGGQQAGLLTGPLYSIHKVISIIKLAQIKEQELGVPVVPVFWIAGEDHDFQEVNHIYVPVGERVDKWVYPEKIVQKKMVTDIGLDKQACLSWVKNVIETFGETEHTNSLLQFANEQIDNSVTFVDFFARIVMALFKEDGLLLVDSGNPEFRQLQRDFFTQQIAHHDAITDALLNQQGLIAQKGFPITIDASENSANLFYYDHTHQERILLEYDYSEDCFVGKSGVVSFSKEELMALANQQPAFLSNNVVTRPLMQEWLFPTLAFIAGPGEISYWAELKQVFEHFQIKMPPIVPRLNITFLDRSVESDINELGLDLIHVLQSGTASAKEQFLQSIKDEEIEELFSTVKHQLLSQYDTIEAKTVQVNRGLVPLLKKNEAYLIKQIDFMQAKLDDAVQQQHDVVLQKYSRIDMGLRPNGSPQERVWNVFYYLNQYGLHFLRDVMNLPFTFDGTHKVIKM